MTLRSTRLAAALAVPALILTAAGCSSSGDSTPDETTAAVTDITFQLDWVKNNQFAGFFVADADGYYADENLSVDFLDGGDVASTAAVIAGGGADMGIVSNMARFADAVATGADLVVVGALYQTSPAGLMTLPDLTISSIDDLEGLRIGTDEAGSADIDTLFTVNGLEPNWEDVRVGWDAAPLFEDQIDAYYAYLTSQPVSYELEGTDVNTVSFADLGYDDYAGLIVTTREFLDANPEAVAGFMTASQAGWDAAIADPEAAISLTLSEYGADLGLDEASELAAFDAAIPFIQSDYTDANGLFAIDLDRISGSIYDTLTASGRTDLPDVDTAFDATIVTAN
ncbi:ABC transporter substrate-binding protein [Microbacterium sediminicola]|uniref:ABC transporter substrate-binding protein n=1 Tax=Microbacterium sediminicola TaxID=415210 RepID=A0ABN2ILJ1_9MICO